MFYVKKRLQETDKKELYADIETQARALLAGERDAVANAANLSALLFQALPQLNWAGFYFLKEGELVVGPFQGKPACVRIPVGRGVCGTAAAHRRTVVVDDVSDFADHIACDTDSRSEIVVPLVAASGELFGVLDLDAPVTARFDAEDRAGLERIAAVWVAALSG